jgi:hypothetical protein
MDFPLLKGIILLEIVLLSSGIVPTYGPIVTEYASKLTIF